MNVNIEIVFLDFLDFLKTIFWTYVIYDLLKRFFGLTVRGL